MASTTSGSSQIILTFKRDQQPLKSHFAPILHCVPTLAHCDVEAVTITSGPLKGRRALITWGLNIPVSQIQTSSFGMNQYQAVRNEDGSGDYCELLIAIGIVT